MEENRNVDESGISLSDIFFLIKKNIIMILLITGLFTLCGGVYGLCFKSVNYKTSSTAIVMSESSSSNSNYQDYLFSNYLVNSFKTFIVSDPVLSKVSEKTGVPKANLAKMVSVNSETNSLILKITVESTLGDEKTIEIANEILDTAIEVANTKQEDGEYKYTVLANNLVDMEYAFETSASRGAAMVILVAMMIGLIISFVIIFIKYSLDDTVNSRDFMEKECGITVLAAISEIKEE